MEPKGSVTSARRPEYRTGQGHVHTYTVIRRATELGWRTIPSVELDEGVRLYRDVVGCEPESVEAGMPVEVTFVHVADRDAIRGFEPR